MAQDKNIGQQSNENWDEPNDERTSGNAQPNPERFQDANLGQGASRGRDEQNDESSSDKNEQGTHRSGSAFNEDQTAVGYGSSQRSERENVGPLDADLSELPSEKRLDRSNQTGPGLG